MAGYGQRGVKGHFERVLLLGGPSFLLFNIFCFGGFQSLCREFREICFFVAVVCNLFVQILHGQYYKWMQQPSGHGPLSILGWHEQEIT